MLEISSSANIFLSSPSSEELRPIRIGQPAYQPAPDQSAVLFVGPASLLPDKFQRYSCASLFFANIISEDGDCVVLCVAALPDRLSGAVVDDRLVEFWTVSYELLDQLTEYDRPLSSMPTEDLKALIEENAARSRRRFSWSRPLNTSLSQNQTAENQASSDAAPAQHSQQKAWKSERIVLPLSVLRELTSEKQAHQDAVERDRCYLEAALQHLRRERQTAKSKSELRSVRRKERSVRLAFHQIGQERRLVRIKPIYSHGGDDIVACRMWIDLEPVA